MLPADMVGGVPAARAVNLEASGEAPTTFTKRVDAVLRDPESSAGNPNRVSAQTINRASLSSDGGVLSEAHGLYEQYHAVHDKLTSLSKTLHLQIEAIGIAVQGVHRGFGNLEEEQRRRFWGIQAEIRELQPKGEHAHRTQGMGY